MASMIKTINPFAKHDVSEYPGVLIPMAQARRHSSIVSEKSTKSAEAGEPAADDASSSSSTGGQAPMPLTIESLRAEIEDDLAAGGHDTAYDRKSKVINKAIQDIGMGRYQWQLFCLCGFGWLADNLWLQGVALTLPSLTAEFGVDENYVRYT
jgi:hypothetical protein